MNIFFKMQFIYREGTIVQLERERERAGRNPQLQFRRAVFLWFHYRPPHCRPPPFGRNGYFRIRIVAGFDPTEADDLFPVAQEDADGVPGLLDHAVGAAVPRLQGRALTLSSEKHVPEAGRHVGRLWRRRPDQ